MPGPLKTAFEGWVFEKFNPEGGPGWFERLKARFREYRGLLDAAQAKHPTLALMNSPILYLHGAIYVLFGSAWAKIQVSTLGRELNDDPSQVLAAAIKMGIGNPVVAEIAQILGTAVTEPVLTLLEREITNPSADPKEFARSFHGIMIGLNTAGGVADTILESLTAGQVEGAGRLLQSMYWSLGLGFLGWQTLAPLLESGLQPGLDRYYKKLARPMRFSASELRDLYALGRINQQTLYDNARDLGWREQDISHWVDLSYRVLNQGEIFDAFHQGLMPEAEAVTKLRALGYDPAIIPLLFKLNPPPQVKTEKELSAGTARQAYREGLISKAELTELLKAAKYSDQEINLIIGIEDTRRIVQNRELTVSQMKQAWEENVISTPEARSWLEKAGFDTAEVDTLVATWEAAAVPEFRKVNIGTITAAYVEGIFIRNQAKEKLVAVGLNPEDADLELDLAEKRNPEAFGKLPKPPERKLTVSLLTDILAAGLITAQEMTARLVGLGYTQTDADLITHSVLQLIKPLTRELPQVSIERAYVAEVLTREQAKQQLIAIRLTAESADLVLDTLDAEIERNKVLPPEEKAKLLSPGALEDLLIAGLITADVMRNKLIAAGYSPEDATLLTTRAEQLAIPQSRPFGQAIIERAYIAGVYDRQRAYDKLISLDFDPADANAILDTVERENPDAFGPGVVQSLRLPSVDALTRALQNGLITESEFISRCLEIGFSAEDAALYLALATRQERKAIKQLTAAQLVNAYGAGFVSWGNSLSKLTQQGYDNSDAVLLLRMEKDLIQNTDAWHSLLDGSLDAFAVLGQLITERYNDDDIYQAFAGLDAGFRQQLGIDLVDLRDMLSVVPGGA